MKRLVFKLLAVIVIATGTYMAQVGPLQEKACNRRVCSTECRLSGCAIGFCDNNVCRCTGCP
jgi:hypothetical protein